MRIFTIKTSVTHHHAGYQVPAVCSVKMFLDVFLDLSDNTRFIMVLGTAICGILTGKDTFVQLLQTACYEGDPC